MSTGDQSRKWNILSGDGGNYLFRAAANNYNKLSQGRGDYIREQSQRTASYDPYTSSADNITGYRAPEVDQFSASSTMGGVGEAHGVSLFNQDALSSPISNSVSVDSSTGVTTLNTNIYGEAPAIEMGQSFTQMAVGLAGSVMDQFTSIGEATAYNPHGYASSGVGVFQTSGGLFAGFNPGGAAAPSERQDHFGRTIRTEGIQDYVEEGGRRWNIDFAGNQTEVNPLTGQALTADAGGLNGFYSSTGWDSSNGSWGGAGGTTSMASFYGTGGGSTFGAPDPVSSFYGYTDPAATNGGTIWGTPSSPTQVANIFGTQETPSYGGNIYGADNTSWGSPAGTQTASTNSIYGTAPSYSTASADEDRNRSNWFFNQTT